MGGNAIKKVLISRMNLDEYKQVKQTITYAFATILQIDFAFDKPGKESYGDLDVLYISNSNIVLKDEIFRLFKPVEIVTNGLVISWAYEYSQDKYFQIDMIKCVKIPMCKFYYSYGDLGNIIGRMTKYHGLKFGHEGLYACIINLDCIELSSDPKSICEYLNLDWDQWVKGFESEEKIFKWIISSKLFVLNIFLGSKESNYMHRHKIETRPMYGNWIIWLESQKLDSSNQRQDLTMKALEHFGKINIYNQLVELKEKQEMLKRKFNGSKLIRAGIDKKIIGIKIQEFKNWIENTQKINFENWIEITDDKIIDENILNYFS